MCSRRGGGIDPRRCVILREVTAHLKELPFALAEGAVSILGGV